MKRWEREYLDYNDPVEVVSKPLPQKRPVPSYIQMALARRRLVLDLRTYAIPVKQIAGHLGVSATRVAQIINHARREVDWEARGRLQEWSPGAWFTTDNESSTGLRIVERGQK